MGEWTLLERIRAKIVDAGDDCAVIPFCGTNLLLTTDMLHQISDFPLGTTPYTIGWRSVGVSLSDIAAMGGRPIGVVLALSAPNLEEIVDEVLSGAQDLCRNFGAELVGGDLDSSDELFLCSSALGAADRPIRRSGARPGDLVVLSGPLGRTAAAVRLFQLGKLEEANALFRFVPRVLEGQRLAEVATAMIDDSDGLAHSIHLLAQASGVGFRVEDRFLPLVPELSTLFPNGALEAAIFYGEDYELLATVPEKKFRPELGTVIGQVVKKGVWIVRDGLAEPLPNLGWEHGRKCID